MGVIRPITLWPFPENIFKTVKPVSYTHLDVYKRQDINSEEFAWAKSYINDMAGKGFISGYEDNTFRPDTDVTRLEALSLFALSLIHS